MLTHLTRRFARSILVALAAVLSIGLAAGAVRLLPWVASPHVPVAVLWVFARVLLAATVEVSLLVACPVGVALESWRLGADHSLRTLHALGVAPARIAAHAAIVAASLALASATVSWSWSPDVQSPGSVSNQLIRAGQGVCTAGRPASIPIVGVSWLCVGGQPRLVGVAGAAPSQVAWSAADAVFTEDLSTAQLRDVRVAVHARRLELSVARASVVGFAPWLAPGAGAASSRALALALVLLLSSAATAWCLVRWPCVARVGAFAVGCAGPVVFLLLADRLLKLQPAVCLACSAALASISPVAVRALMRRLGLSAAPTGGT